MCGKVYVPSRGADPQLGVPTTEQVELPHVGTLRQLLRGERGLHGQGMEIPYTCALILLDGADLPLMHLIQECPVRRRPHRACGSRPCGCDEADLGPTLESIQYFRPNGEPDGPVTQPGEGVTW